MYNTKISQTWEEFIRQEYANYKSFTNNLNMPSYKINFVDGDETPVSYIMQANTSCNPMILNVNTVYMVDGKYQHCQPSLFHEFTHMCDSENLFKEKETLDKRKFLSLYTEYHASQIEFLRFIEYDSINDLKDIQPLDEFYEFDEKISVVNYYLNKCRLLFMASCQYRANKTVDNYKFLMDAYMYVFGIKSIYDKIIGTIAVPQINDIFYDHMLTIYPLFQEYDIDKLWNILLENINILDIICAEDIVAT